MDPSDLPEINQLYSAYSRYADAGDGEGFASCFTEQATLNTGSGKSVGRQAIAAFGAAVPSMMPGIRHFISNVHITEEDGEVTGGAYLIVMSTSEGPKPMLSGRYDDRLLKQNDKWLFSERTMTPDFVPARES